MASIVKTIPATAGADAAWQKISDVGAVDQLVDMIQSCSLDGDTRTCGFPDGQMVKERIISVDQDNKRIAYSVTDGPMPVEFHLAGVQVVEQGESASVVWTVDIKPDELATPMSELMDVAAQSMAAALA